MKKLISSLIVIGLGVLVFAQKERWLALMTPKQENLYGAYYQEIMSNYYFITILPNGRFLDGLPKEGKLLEHECINPARCGKWTLENNEKELVLTFPDRSQTRLYRDGFYLKEDPHQSDEEATYAKALHPDSNLDGLSYRSQVAFSDLPPLPGVDFPDTSTTEGIRFLAGRYESARHILEEISSDSGFSNIEDSFLAAEEAAAKSQGSYVIQGSELILRPDEGGEYRSRILVISPKADTSKPSWIYLEGFGPLELNPS